MRCRPRTIKPRADEWTARARHAFAETVDYDPVKIAKREADIAALPTVQWRGRTLYTIRCDADFGKGPHLMNVPAGLLWSLISVHQYRCVFHNQ